MRLLRSLFLAVLLLGLSVPATAYDTRRVVMITLDGLRHDKLNSDTTPHLVSWRDSSTVYSNVLNLSCTYTGPGHTSLISGNWSWIQMVAIAPPSYKSRSGKPSLADLVHAQNADTSLVASSKVGTSKPWQETLWPDSAMGTGQRAAYYTTLPYGDTLVADSAWAWMSRLDATFALINFGTVDAVGHSFYNSPGCGGYMANYGGYVKNADSLVAVLWDSVQTTVDWADSTTFIITTDHGRHSPYFNPGGTMAANDSCHQEHGDHCVGCIRCFAWIRGPDTNQGDVFNYPVYQIDLGATSAHLLQVNSPTIEGRVLSESFSSFADLDTLPYVAGGGGTRLARGYHSPSIAIGDSVYLAVMDTSYGIYLKAKALSGGSWRGWSTLFSRTADVDTVSIGDTLWSDFEDGTLEGWYEYKARKGCAGSPVELVSVSNTVEAAYYSARACSCEAWNAAGEGCGVGKYPMAGLWRRVPEVSAADGASVTELVFSFDLCIDSLHHKGTAIVAGLVDSSTANNANIFDDVVDSDGWLLMVEELDGQMPSDSVMMWIEWVHGNGVFSDIILHTDTLLFYPDEWHHHSVYWKADSANGAMRWWVDGISAYDSIGALTGFRHVNYAGIGALKGQRQVSRGMSVHLDNLLISTSNQGCSLIDEICGPPEVIVVGGTTPVVFYPILVDSSEGNAATGVVFWALEQLHRSGGSWSSAKRTFLNDGYAMSHIYDVLAYKDDSIFAAAVVDTNLLQPHCGTSLNRWKNVLLKRTWDAGNTWSQVWLHNGAGEITHLDIVAQGEEIAVCWVRNSNTRNVFMRTSVNHGQTWGPVQTVVNTTGAWDLHEFWGALGLQP